MGQITLKAVDRTKNEILPYGAISFNTETGMYKIGDGHTLLSSLPEYGDAVAVADAAIATLVGDAPAALDKLNELADALGDDPNFATTILNDLAGKEDVGISEPLVSTVIATSANLVGDGVTNDSVAATAAILAMPSNGILRFNGARTYLFNTAVAITKNMTVRGDGMWVTTIKAGGSPLFNAAANTPVDEVVFENLCLDGAGLASIICSFNGNPVIRKVIFRRCRFTNIKASGSAVSVQGGLVVFEDCLGHQPASLAGFGRLVLLQSGAKCIVRGGEYLWLNQIMSTEAFSGDSHLSEYLAFENIVADQFWTVIPAVATGSGGTVTYSATVLTDTAKDFTTILGVGNTPNAVAYPNSCLLRVMPVRFASGGSGITTVNPSAVVDTAATFVTNGVSRGDIVRTSNGKFALVSGVESETVCRVEEWLDNTTLRPTANPAVGTTYTIYRFIYGYATAKTATTLTVPYWTDFFGNRITPDAGTLYEIMQARPSQLFAPGTSTRRVRYSGLTLRRPWADAMGTTAQRTRISDVLVTDGQDFGITLAGSDCTVVNAQIEHCGAGAIWSAGDDNTILGVKGKGNCWNFTNPNAAQISLNACSRNQVKGCNLEATSEGVQAVYGIVCLVSGGSHELDNIYKGHASGKDVAITNAAITNVRTRGTSQITTVAGVAPIIDHYYAGSPEGVISAAPGSTIRDITNGVLYVKSSGFGNTGWIAGTHHVRAVKSSDQASIVIAAADVTDLAVPIGANETWEIEFGLYYEATTTGDMSLTVTVPAGSAGLWGMEGIANNAASSTGSLTGAANALAGLALGGVGLGTKLFARITAVITNGSTAGVVQLRFSQNVLDGANATTIFAKSFVLAHKMS